MHETKRVLGLSVVVNPGVIARAKRLGVVDANGALRVDAESQKKLADSKMKRLKALNAAVLKVDGAHISFRKVNRNGLRRGLVVKIGKRESNKKFLKALKKLLKQD